MKKLTAFFVVMISALSLLAGCSQMQQANSNSETSNIDSIPFEKNQLYAVAYLGYDEIDSLSFYTQNYLDSEISNHECFSVQK